MFLLSFLFFLQYILVFLFCSFCDLCKTWASSSDACDVVRCAFSVCLLWSRPPLAFLLQKERKKEKTKDRNREVKLQTQSEFLVFHCFCPGFKKEFSLEGNLMGFPKVSNKYPHPKTQFVSPTCRLKVLLLCWKKGSLVWLNQNSS